MKNFVKWFGIIAFVAVIGFLMVGCDFFGGDYEDLNGDWDRGDIVITFKSSNGTFAEIKSNSGWYSLLNNGSIHIGDKKIKNIKKTSDLNWTCQELTLEFTWVDCTITMDADGKSFQSYTPNAAPAYVTYTKKQ